MATKIDTVTGRDKLKARHAPYWQKIRSECHLGYRKTTPDSMGTWIARFRDDSGKYQLSSMGALDSLPNNRRFDEAVKLANQWFEHRSVGGLVATITVGEACTRYVQKQRDEGRAAGAKDLESRFKRWMHPEKKLSGTPVTKLTQSQVHEWRVKLPTLPASLQDRTKTGTRPRVASSTKPDWADCYWPQQLVVCDLAPGRSTCGCRHEPNPVGQALWAGPYAYKKDVLARLPTLRASMVEELLPHRRQQALTRYLTSTLSRHSRCQGVFATRLRFSEKARI